MTINSFGTFDPEASKNMRLWRYVDLISFVALVHSGRLYLPLLASLEDPWEGSPGMQDMVRHAAEAGTTPAEQVEALAAYQARFRHLRSKLAASCWYGAEHESAAMWELYAARGRGIALQSTVGRLLSSMEADWPLTIGRVNYIDHLSSSVTGSDLGSAFAKNRAYEHESEVRIIVELSDFEVQVNRDSRRLAGRRWTLIEDDRAEEGSPPVINQVRMGDWDEIAFDGVYVTVDVDQLLERVVLSPKMDFWEAAAVEAVANGLGLAAPIKPSDLAVPPLHSPMLGRMILHREGDIGGSDGGG